jgi:hypothetical protein
MQDLTVKRTLVKSPPELWSELSEVERLAKHLDAFGEIKITRLEPESTVAWEGEGASGTVSIEPSGWGTKVTLTARVEGEEPAPPPPPLAPEPVEAASPRGDSAETSAIPTELPEPPTIEEPAEPARRGFLSRLFGRERRRAALAGDAEAPVWVAGAAPPAEPIEEAPAEPAPTEPDPFIAEEPSQPIAREEPAEGATLNPARAQAALEGVLEALGSAHHRPFSRG